MKTSYKLFYYYFVINDIWNNIAFQIDENIIYEHTLNMYKKPGRFEMGIWVSHIMTLPKKNYE